MKIVSPLPHKRGRIEIIPLIDIMFFLLAAFMVVSIGKIHVKSLKVSLPTDVPAAQKEAKEDFISISLDSDGLVQIDKEVIASKDALLAKLQALYSQNKDQKFLISADKDTHHGDVMAVLGRLRSAGFQKIAFSIKNERNPISGGSDTTPAATSQAPPSASETTSSQSLETPASNPAVSGPALAPAPTTAVPTAPSTAPTAH
jgi:biopolymer transport protein ExbD